MWIFGYPVSLINSFPHGPLARYIKLRVAHASGMPGTFFPSSRVSDPDMHHGTCVTHVSWYMPGSLTSGFLWSRWRGKRSRHPQRMRNPQLYVRGPWYCMELSFDRIRAHTRYQTPQMIRKPWFCQPEGPLYQTFILHLITKNVMCCLVWGQVTIACDVLCFFL